MGLKVLSVKEFILSHLLLVIGLTLVSLGLSLDAVGYTITGIWAIALGVCLGLSFILAKLVPTP